MVYEFCLEYGTFPVKERNGFFLTKETIPEFMKEDSTLIARLQEMNSLFHELFITIECKFDYIGQEFPEKIDQLRPLYDQLSKEVLEKYGDREKIMVEEFIL
ncbi:hypothetical protein K6V78_07575 [Streptococcus gallolyticus]|uniref:hypothetical protein n=1 Tax=Streptococcus hepaticus TaxID=3349163 RepID=UPI001C9438D8|nr:hypothetical protein [Streptococcus gallolyticus]MBY5041170.1 hypothetical protein [Streptococcus gallolyticus]